MDDRLMLRAAIGERAVGSCSVGDAPITIGSWDGATLRIDDPALLPVHVVIDRDGPGTWRLVAIAPDGCTVNGVAVRRTRLHVGDAVVVGPYLVSFDGEASAVELRVPSKQPAVRATLRWGRTPLDVRVVENEAVLAGPGGTFDVSPTLFGAPKETAYVPLAVRLDGAWHVPLDLGLRLVERDSGRPFLTAEARELNPRLPARTRPAKLWAPLPDDVPLRLEAGDLAIELEPATRLKSGRTTREPFLIRSEGQALVIGLLIFLFCIAVLHNPPASPFLGASGQEKTAMHEVLAQFRNPPSEALRERIKRWSKEPESEAAAKANGEEGRAGRQQAPDRDTQRAGPDAERDVVRQHALLRALGAAEGTTNRLLSGGALASARHIGHLDGASAGDAQGTLGLGMRGNGSGGGGLSAETVGVGPVGTRGVGAGTADGKLGATGASELVLDEPIAVEGGLDREVIRRVILSHRAQIRYCYERELQQSPGLAGKVLVEFVIGGDGRVTQARAANDSVGGGVGACVVSKVKGWTFPQPKGGGVVVVSYPFLFKPAGQQGD